MLWTALAFLALTVAGCAPAFTEITSLGGPGRYEVSLPGSGIALGGILFRPTATEGLLPAIIVLHGWAESAVPGAPRVEPTAKRLAEQGYVALAVSMRGWPPSGGRDDCGLEQPDDIAKAADWVASLPGIRPDRIGVFGFSQGAQVALLAAARSPRIKAVVAYYPVTDVQQWQRTTSHAGIRNSYIPQVCGMGKWQSPLFVAKTIRAAVLLVHGDRDTRVPTDQSLRMRDALVTANRTVELKIIAGAEHGFDYAQSEQAWSSATTFLRTHLLTTE